jgi:hypothetical protein
LLQDIQEESDDLNPWESNIEESWLSTGIMYGFASLDGDAVTRIDSRSTGNTQRCVEAVIEGAALVTPRGAGATFCLPSSVQLILRFGAPWSYSAAFEQPVEADGRGHIIPSIERLSAYEKRLTGEMTRRQSWYCTKPGAVDRAFNVAIGGAYTNMPGMIAAAETALIGAMTLT